MRLLVYLLPRFVVALVTMFGVSLLVFLSLRAIPGGYADILLGPFVTPAAREAISQRYGLDEPVVIQFLRWLAALLQADFGVSMVTRQPVLDEFLRRAPVTIELALIALGSALLLGLPLGALAGIGSTGRGGNVAGRLIGAIGSSIPDFVLGRVLIFVFSALSLGLLIGGFVPFSQDPVENLRVMLLPGLTLSVFGMALILRTTRDVVLRVMTEGYITAAVARGERPFEIVRRHVLRNAAIPVVTVIGTYFGFLLGGAVIVEVLFSVPGIGLYAFNGLQNRDYAIVQAGVLLAAAVFIAINMLADIAYALIDPRIGSEQGR